jgi:hypothetical protein
MSGFITINRYTIKMTISEQDILRTLMKSHDRISAAAWVVSMQENSGTYTGLESEGSKRSCGIRRYYEKNGNG